MSHHEDYPDTVARLAAADDKTCAVAPEAYAHVVTALLQKMYAGDYLDDAETILANTLPELSGQPRCSATDIDPRYLAWLVMHPQHLPDHYTIVRQYLTLKLDNLDVMNDDEQALVALMPELDPGRMVTHVITPQLLHDVAVNPETLSAELRHDLELYLGDKVIDRQELSVDEMRLLAQIADGVAADTDAVLNGGRSGIPPVELAELEYGYDPYDFEALLWRLSGLYQLQTYGSRPPLRADEGDFQQDVNTTAVAPLNRREQRVILQAWDFEPTDRKAVEAVFAAYYRSIDVLNAEVTHYAYVSAQQRYRGTPERDGTDSL